MSLAEHLERYLGEIEAGWSRDAAGNEMPFQIVRLPRGSGSGTISFATLGLSRYPLHSPTGKEVRHELLMIVPDSWRDGPIPGLMQQVGAELLAASRPLLRGEVIGPRGELVPNSPMEAVYAAIPVYLPDSFAMYEGDDEQIAIVWLVPVTAAEAAYARARGWKKFEERLVETDPDLTDLYRPSIPL